MPLPESPVRDLRAGDLVTFGAQTLRVIGTDTTAGSSWRISLLTLSETGAVASHLLPTVSRIPAYRASKAPDAVADGTLPPLAYVMLDSLRTYTYPVPFTLQDAYDEATAQDVDDETFRTEAERILSRTVYTCEDCDQLSFEDDGTYVYDGDRFVCASCWDNYSSCDSCGYTAYSDSFRYVPNEGDYCESCFNDQFRYCEDCDEYVRADGHDDHEPENCECDAPHLHFTFPANGHGTIAQDERLTVTLPAGAISPEGIQAIIATVHEATEGLSCGYVADVVTALEPTWQTARGNFTRRLSSALYKAHKVKLLPATISAIGNVAREHSSSDSSYDVEVTRNLNLPAEDFYHEDSCWWQSYSAGRCALKNWGGLGIRTFDDHGTVTGRAWVLPLTEDLRPTHDTMTPAAYVVYNGYGNLEGYVATRIVAYLAGMTYRKVSLTLRPMFVNGSKGYLVSTEETCQSTPEVNYDGEGHEHDTSH